MWVRAVAAALAVWCVSGTAMAAGYTEVWNPPEASGHTAKPSKKTTGKQKRTSGAGSAAAGRSASKAGSKHLASNGHAASKVVASSGSKAGTHGTVKKVVGKGMDTPKKPGVRKVKPKTPMMVQDKKPHAQLVQTKTGHAKVMQANLTQGRHARA